MTEYYKIEKSRLEELLRAEHEASYFNALEEYGEDGCSASLIFRDMSDEKLKMELSYFKPLEKENQWLRYIEYLKSWANDHYGVEYEGMSPACYDEFCENDDDYEDD